MTSISATEAMHRAIRLWDWVSAQIDAGGTVQVTDAEGRIREVVLL